MLCWLQVLAISRYDGRGAMSLQDSVKRQHILPFFPNFVLLATRLENLLGATQGHSPGDARSLPPSLPCALRPPCPALISVCF